MSTDGPESVVVHGLMGRLQDLQWICSARVQCMSLIYSAHDESILGVAFQEASAACRAVVARLTALQYDVLDPAALAWHSDLEQAAAEVRCCSASKNLLCHVCMVHFPPILVLVQMASLDAHMADALASTCATATLSMRAVALRNVAAVARLPHLQAAVLEARAALAQDAHGMRRTQCSKLYATPKHHQYSGVGRAEVVGCNACSSTPQVSATPGCTSGCVHAGTTIGAGNMAVCAGIYHVLSGMP